MPATAIRAAFIAQEFRSAVAGPDSGVVTKYGDKARDTRDEPIPTSFDTVSDGLAMATERLTLLKADRRRFKADIQGEATGLALDYSQVTPAVTFNDTERLASIDCAVVGVTIDFNTETTSLELWG